MIKEMTALEFEKECRTYVGIKSKYKSITKEVLKDKYTRIEEDEDGYIRIYDQVKPEEIVEYLYQKKILISEIKVDKIGLEEYYIDLMKEGRC